MPSSSSADRDLKEELDVSRWTRELSLDEIKAVCYKALNQACTVSFYTQGTFNKLYLIVTAQGESSLLRVTLTAYPRSKTSGEVATLQWLRANTGLPIPKVLAFQGSPTPKGFEWMIMERMPGKPLREAWRGLSMQQKVALVERLAEFQAELHASSHLRFPCIGTLQPGEPTPGRIVSHRFFMADHPRYKIPWGPFSSSRDWMDSQLQILILSLDGAGGGAEETRACAKKLREVLPTVFPEKTDGGEAVIWHDDLSMANILVDTQGEITAIIDWECVSALPLWVATRYPCFFTNTRAREEEPQRDENSPDNELYWTQLMEYEVTQLRVAYDTRMDQLWPERKRMVEDKGVQMQLEYYDAFLQLAGGTGLKEVEEWVEKIQGGELAGCNLNDM
ncbi:Phosphotransferase enzyme family-domain-containing protein [Mycena kentingensis (nom. inval.)]|nr:Phosphotransferase enzyme family-domain-containing protein [Mycena kentingensis (nom. inval.)]